MDITRKEMLSWFESMKPPKLEIDEIRVTSSPNHVMETIEEQLTRKGIDVEGLKQQLKDLEQ